MLILIKSRHQLLQKHVIFPTTATILIFDVSMNCKFYSVQNSHSYRDESARAMHTFFGYCNMFYRHKYPSF